MIDFRNVSFSYDGTTPVLSKVSLHVDAGQFACILGGNGSGKSTLAKHINALLVPDEGTVEVLGHDTADPASTFFIRGNAGMVFQNPDDQIVASLIENDVAFGPENLGIEAEEIRQRVTDALAQVGLQGFERNETASLSGGQKQRVAIAGVLAMQPQILVLDEASAMLDPRGRAGLARVCRELNDAGMTIVMITHFMEEAALADKVFVLDAGKVVMEGAPEEVLVQAGRLEGLSLDVPFAARMSLELQRLGIDVPTFIDQDALAKHLVGRLPRVVAEPGAGSSPALAEQDPARAIAASDAYIRLENVSYSYDPRAAARKKEAETESADWGNDPSSTWALRDVSLDVERGSVLGIAGHTGSGKSTLVQHMNGLLQPTSGRVLVDGVDISDKVAAHAARADVGLVFQYPEHQLFAATVFEDVAFGPRNLDVPEEEMERRVADALEMVELDFEALRERSPFELSGGQQRRVAFAGVLSMNPSTLILDEPVAGLDPRAREEFLSLIERLHRHQGLTVVLVSHNMNDLARMCDTVVLMNQGTIFDAGTPAEVFADPARAKSIGLGVPDAMALESALAEHGISLGISAGQVPTIASLARAIAQVDAAGAPLR